MLKSYLVTAWRNLKKNKLHSFINVFGLAIGMGVAILIGLWAYDEVSFNTWHKNYSSIARIESNASYNGEIYTIDSHPMPLGTELAENYKSDFKYVVMSTSAESHMLQNGDKKFSDAGRYMQPEAADMLSLEMLEGSRTGLIKPNTVLLSRTLAQKLFGNEAAINKIVTFDNQFTAEVAGVYNDLPNNSDFKDAHYIAPLNFYLSSYSWARKKYTDWNNITINVFVQLNKGVSFSSASAHIKNILVTHVSGDFKARNPTLFLHPMSRWHLYSNFKNGISITSNQLQYVWLYSTVGLCVLLLACINFTNLSTAHAQKRAKEVGIRKAIGSKRSSLIKQFFSESLMIAFLAFIIALVLTNIGLPGFNAIAGKQLSMPYVSPVFWLCGFAFTVFTGLLAGAYPAIYLSSFRPVKVLKGTLTAGRYSALPRKVLVTAQFTLSVALIACTAAVYNQVQFAKNRPVGYTQQNLLQVEMNSPDMESKFTLFANELKSNGGVTEVAASASPVTSIWSTNTGFSWQGNSSTQQQVEFSTINITPGYGKTIGWQFVQGRDFSNKLSTDSNGLVLNEAAANLMGLKNAAGEHVQWTNLPGINFTILGVVKNMVMESPFAAASPTIFFVHQKDGMNRMLLKLSPQQSTAQSLDKVKAVFKKLTPDMPLAYSFVDEEFNHKFAAEERVGAISVVFAVLAIIISCLGLFGMVSFVAEQRTKEIGIRKVLGASVLSVWQLLSSEFLVLVIIAILIASPVAYYVMHSWLQQYQYHILLSWQLFAMAGLAVVFIALATVSWQTIKASLANPVKSLKTE